MFKKTIIFFAVLWAAFFLITAILIVWPLCSSPVAYVFSKGFPTLTEARNYYAIISNITGFLASSMGILLGAFYYFHKNSLEDQRNEKKRRHENAQMVIKYLETYYTQVLDILKATHQAENELKALQEKAETTMDRILSLLDMNKQHANFGEQERKAILGLYSFVDNHELISFSLVEKANQPSYEQAKNEFKERYNDAFTACIKYCDNIYS